MSPSRSNQDGRYPPIGHYGLLSDCHGSALVSLDGSVDWCCPVRFDSRPIFARLLHWDGGGYFRIAPRGWYRSSRRYLPGTNILETRFDTATGVLVLTDFLAMEPGEGEGEETGGSRHPSAADRLIRRLRCERDTVAVRVEYVPRFNYGTTTPHFLCEDDPRLVVAYGGADALVFQSGVPLEVHDDERAEACFDLAPGNSADFVLSYSLQHLISPQRLGPDEVEECFRSTREVWRRWSGRCAYSGVYEEEVRRSALVLKGLTNVETGAIVAAPTTSLPEKIGGERNWDYRYSWLRDASLVLNSLFHLGYRDEGNDFVGWLQRTTAGVPRQMQIMYGGAGELFLPEVCMDDIEGYRGSRPVRIGNRGAKQFQLDVFGEVVDAAWRYHCNGGEISDDQWKLLQRVVDHVGEHWDEPDSGIWEVRSQPEQFVHSKVMCWVAADRAIRLAQARGVGEGERVRGWRRTRNQIRARVLDEGVVDDRFVRAFGSEVPDASALRIPLVGFVPPEHELAVRTRKWIERELGEGAFLRRYRADDGLPGGEGVFLICSFWLVENLARSGEIERGREVFERLLEVRSDLGLFSEEVCTETGELLGNFPQALSHIGLINAALAFVEERDVVGRNGGAPSRDGKSPARPTTAHSAPSVSTGSTRAAERAGR